MRAMFDRDGVLTDDTTLKINVTAAKAEGVTKRFTDFTIQVQFPENMDEAYRKKMLVAAERACTISNTLMEASNIHLQEA